MRRASNDNGRPSQRGPKLTGKALERKMWAGIAIFFAGLFALMAPLNGLFPWWVAAIGGAMVVLGVWLSRWD